MKNTTNKTLTIDARQLDVVVLAVYLLGGDTKSVDTEDVAVKAYEFAPGMFSWQKYPDQINLEIVRVNLSNAKKTQYQELLSGSGRAGWRLTTQGLAWANSIGKSYLEKNVSWNQQRFSAGSVDTVRKRREHTRITSTKAWADWQKTKSITIRDAQDLFRIDEYATKKMLEIKIVRLQSMFESDADIADFLKLAGERILGKDGE